MLARLAAEPELLSETQRAQVRVLARDRDAIARIPADEQAAFSRLTCEAQDVWRRAKSVGDWESFAPYLDRIVEARLRMAAARDGSRDPYDVWLDEYEPGCDAAFYDRFFSSVRECVVPLLADCVASRRKPSRACVEGRFDVGRQWELAHDLVALEGVDEKALWLGRTEHPFTGGPSTGFVLIAGHAYEDDVLSNVFSMLHEAATPSTSRAWTRRIASPRSGAARRWACTRRSRASSRTWWGARRPLRRCCSGRWRRASRDASRA